MSVEIRMTLKDADKWASAFKRAPAVATRECGAALTETITVLQRAMVNRAPVNRQMGGGTLRQSIRGSVSGLRGIIEVGAKYGAAVHEGTRPHIIRAVNKRVLANKRTGQFFGKVVHHPGTRARPFMREALADSEAQINSIFGDALNRVAQTIHP